MGIKYNFQIKLRKKFKVFNFKQTNIIGKDHKNKCLGLTLKSTKINHHPFQYYYPLLKKRLANCPYLFVMYTDIVPSIHNA